MTQSESDRPLPVRQFINHARTWRDNLYVYPVVSRRSRGVSVGVNLNPDAACNFDCVYCQVDRSRSIRTRTVELSLLRQELESMLECVTTGRLFEDPEFAEVPGTYRVLRDIAFSGDGEPTTCPLFAECVEMVADVKYRMGAVDAQIVLITDACYLTRERVAVGLSIMDRNNGRIWAKLDAGTETYFRLVNRPNHTLDHVLRNIIETARVRPIVIQSLFLRMHGAPPPSEELDAYAQRLADILDAGGAIEHVQVYTVARWTAEAFAEPLTNAEVDAIADLVGPRTGLRVECYYAPAGYDRATAPH